MAQKARSFEGVDEWAYLIMTPTIRHLIEELHRSTERDPAAIQTIYHQHNSALAP